MKLKLTTLLLAVALSGCHQIWGEPATIRFKTAAPLALEDEAVIADRLRDHAVSYLPTFTVHRKGSDVTVDAKGAPSESNIRFLLSRRGVFEVRSEGGTPWLSNNDVLGATANFDEQGQPALSLVLSKPAGDRLARLSAAHVNGTVLVVLDGEVLASARVAGPIPNGRLQVHAGKNVGEVMLIATILKFGSLSAAPEDIHVQPQR